MKKKQITVHENLPMIEVANPLLLDTLLSDKRTGHLIIKRLDERVAIVSPGQMETLLTKLKKLGHLPKVL
ncbi:MAG: hypothetical protein N5P05_003079 [Chroococcopsis gigantea SAG 12.99]|jgi:DNA-binding PadR family transcriptional regulator|nr:hypothetical protein [Chlorogloea purpurea SAG 13.99]MDV3001473.1 hypothetical protein [Chroococcopsis gigantea SAG 12.99]